MLTITDRGLRNVLEIDPGSAQTLAGELILDGDDNVVVIGAGCRSDPGFRLQLGSSSSVRLGERCTLGSLFVYALRDARVEVGADSGFNGAVRLLLHEPGSITIGHGALFAGDIDVTDSDMHSIVDSVSGRRLNAAADVAIGNRVWVGQRSMILKGSSIGDGSVVGSMSLVSGTLPADSVCAGVPARVLRSGATWRFDLIPVEPAEPGDGSTGPGRADPQAAVPPHGRQRRVRRKVTSLGRRAIRFGNARFGSGAAGGR